jgi:hypothetical protein
MSQQLQITGGAKVRDLQDVIIGTSGVLSSLAFNVANGVPKLDVNGKILVSQLPNSVMEYKGTWDASTNTPTLVNGTGNQGDVYLCNVAGTTNFGAGPITFAVGDSAIYSGTIWQRAGGATGTVTSVGLTSTGNDAITITGSPITTSGNINLGFAGTNLQYINGTGDLTTFPTLISSIGLTMPSAFSVANSPLTSNGTIAVTGAGYPSQYIRGDGTLADFPTSGGGGSSVSYYLNGGTSQGTIGGVTYYEMSKIADTGAGVDFPKTGDGLIVSFLTDAGDPAQLNIPAGNWNYEIYASMSSNGGTPQLYAELYVYNGTTFTLISTSSNEILYDGVNLNLYTFAMAVPATTLALTDRLAIKLYSTNSGGKTTTVHTQNGHLCQIITTFSTGITALNGLTAQVQYFATGTSGTDFNISSSTATHTFNIPDASASARGLITTGSQTIAGDKAFTGINSFDYGINYKTGASLANVSGYISQAYAKSGTGAGSTLSLKISDGNSVKAINLDFVGSPATYTYTFPDFSGTVALASQLTSYLPLAGGIMTGSILLNNNLAISGQLFGTSSYASMLAMSPSDKVLIDNSGRGVNFGGTIGNGTYTYTLPSATGTLALTSDITTGYVPYTGATADVNLGTFDLSAYAVSADILEARLNGTASSPLILRTGTSGFASGLDAISLISSPSSANTLSIISDVSSVTKRANIGLGSLSATRTYTLPDASGTLALTSDIPSLTGYVPYTGATQNLSLGSNVVTAQSYYSQAGIFLSISGQATSGSGFATINGGNTYLDFRPNNGGIFLLSFPYSTTRTFTLPDANGTLALGTGTTNYVSKWTGTNTIGNSLIFDNGTNVGIGNTNTSYTLDVSGTGRFTSTLLVSGAATFSSSVTAKGFLYLGEAAVENGVINSPEGLYLNADSDASGGSNDIVFGKGRTSTSGGTTFMTIKNGGNVGIGTSTPSYTLDVSGQVGINSGSSTPFVIFRNYSSGSVTIEQFVQNGVGTIGSITFNGTSVLYNATSDYRLKQDFKDYNALSIISSIKTYDFEWKSNKTRSYGVIAHELAEIIPSIVSGDKDALDEDGRILPQGLDYSKIVPILVKAIQEQQTLITSLQTRLATLENK